MCTHYTIIQNSKQIQWSIISILRVYYFLIMNELPADKMSK